ncbi:MAG: hypothetical protein EAZ18_11660 [Oscillatoriales cyanobacterium]|nr:MAG: hypothetical protein EAZ18_11660 [Oscillatoriales cyanobacterium]
MCFCLIYVVLDSEQRNRVFHENISLSPADLRKNPVSGYPRVSLRRILSCFHDNTFRAVNEISETNEIFKFICGKVRSAHPCSSLGKLALYWLTIQAF